MKFINSNFAICLFILMPSFFLEASPLIFMRQKSEPKYFAKEFPKKGLCDQIYLALQNELKNDGVQVVIEDIRLPIKRILFRLENGEGHAFCGAGRNKSREEKFIYSKSHVYYVSNKVAAHKTETLDPKTLEELAKSEKAIGALHGTSSAAFLREHKGVRLNDRIYEIERGLELVSGNGVLRYFYYHDLGLNYYVAHKFKDLKVMSHKFRTVPQWLLMSKSLSSKQVESLNKALGRMHQKGTFKKIWAKFF